ncbi:hypothetical protein [Nocardioides daeguensis]|uniref:Uncharacterized protein n=1 Tax=Nocardioides daeguensis TaxID=908359 RepID=A0ABP6WBI1_9ACTN|nr:hypothetical protein [Nocardioides daeguensis]MBV6729788.1 hypothetical protein [Nocardioides daeguensis]MCR1773556.1 hypothetical protein [Nocardioides daeguensis]
MSSLLSLVGAAPSGRPRPVLLDHRDYATAVIRQGAPVPWTDLAALTGHVQQVHALLDPDTTWIDGGALYAAHLAAHPDLLEQMGARSRTGYPLRVLLADEGGVERVVRTAGTLAEACRRPLVVSVPSPAVWLGRAHALTPHRLESVDEIAADTASMYLAEWLGKLGALPVALVVLDARTAPGDTPVEVPERLGALSALTNVAAHFEWSVAVRHETGLEIDGVAVGVVPDAFWSGDADLPDGDALLATIPATATPERVLDQLAVLG